MSGSAPLAHIMTAALHNSSLHSLPLLSRGKVRDNYAVGDDKLLIVTSDRLSAFDVVMNEPIPDKGRVLNHMALFWFDQLADVVPNHLTGIAPETVVAPDEVPRRSRGRSMVVKRLKPIMVEAVVRGYLIGSGWKDYQDGRLRCVASALPAGSASWRKSSCQNRSSRPRTQSRDRVSTTRTSVLRPRWCRPLARRWPSVCAAISLELYRRAAKFAAKRGIIIADTKFEFGLDDAGTLHLMDEVLTADSSRFWPADSYKRRRISPPSFDKQYVRDYLETLKDWAKRPPPPPLPAEVVERTAAKYREALVRLTGQEL
jgi:phosphoribosylaminoimidazole-succinocarboxamide synthase